MPEVFIQGGEGKLQAKYSPSEQEKPNIAIILHPNPKHGGTMDTKVNYAAFKVMKDAGFSTLRINFRGVGKSDGAFTEGEGELNDASVSLDWLQKKNEDFRSCWSGWYWSPVKWIHQYSRMDAGLYNPSRHFGYCFYF